MSHLEGEISLRLAWVYSYLLMVSKYRNDEYYNIFKINIIQIRLKK